MLADLGRELGYRLHVIDLVDWEGRSVRSSAIRELVKQGDVGEAADLLGRPYHATGKSSRATTAGAPSACPRPTSNCRPTNSGLPMASMPRAPICTPGVRVYNSATNLGVRPTVDGLQHTFETHLLDFPPPGQDGDIYGQTVTSNLWPVCAGNSGLTAWTNW